MESYLPKTREYCLPVTQEAGFKRIQVKPITIQTTFASLFTFMI